MITIPWDEIRDGLASRELPDASLNGKTPVTPQTARRLACDAEIIPAVSAATARSSTSVAPAAPGPAPNAAPPAYATTAASSPTAKPASTAASSTTSTTGPRRSDRSPQLRASLPVPPLARPPHHLDHHPQSHRTDRSQPHLRAACPWQPSSVRQEPACCSPRVRDLSAPHGDSPGWRGQVERTQPAGSVPFVGTAGAANRCTRGRRFTRHLSSGCHSRYAHDHGSARQRRSAAEHLGECR